MIRRHDRYSPSGTSVATALVMAMAMLALSGGRQVADESLHMRGPAILSQTDRERLVAAALVAARNLLVDDRPVISTILFAHHLSVDTRDGCALRPPGRDDCRVAACTRPSPRQTNLPPPAC